ncbi:MAG: RAP domain-containing protein [Micrococcaceae bacterium]
MQTHITELKSNLILVKTNNPYSQWNNRTIAKAYKTGKLFKVWRGSYIKSSYFQSLGINDKKLLRIIAAKSAVDKNMILSHASAARFHNLGVLQQENLVYFRSPNNQQTHSKLLKYYRYQDQANIVITEIGLVTTIVQTVVDCAREMNFIEALVIADSARNKGCMVKDIYTILENSKFKRGRRKVEAVLEHSSSKSDSVAETIARFNLYIIGMPSPELQKELFYEGHRYRVDIAYPEYSLIVEVDGKQKYFELTDDIKETLYHEKLRQDIIERNGWKIVRLTWSDIHNFDKLRYLFGNYISNNR